MAMGGMPVVPAKPQGTFGKLKAALTSYGKVWDS